LPSNSIKRRSMYWRIIESQNLICQKAVARINSHNEQWPMKKIIVAKTKIMDWS
jgi:hypothetical protein